ncbi:transcriptional regulator [Microbacterium lacus]|uniref:LysR substrate-binding domain-containing protein n=1 Tax=Microbacterium lacus TaxID=415217 RepID=UPI0038507C01
MAKGGGSRSPRSGKSGKDGKDAASRRTAKGAASAHKKKQQPKPVPVVDPGPQMPEHFTLGAIAGATPGKWIDAWQERYRRVPLLLHPLHRDAQRSALVDGEVDAALVRLPIGREGLHVIALYEELPVVVASADSHLCAAEELTLDDLGGEVVITPLDDVVRVSVPGAVAPRFAAPETTEEAIATVAAGVGVVIVPMSLARLHHRKDTEWRVLQGVDASTVALAWVADADNPAVAAFVGIVRGRTANSSRD